MNKIIIILGLTILSGAIFSCADPRKNCNHPKHAEYVKEKQLKKQGFKIQ